MQPKEQNKKRKEETKRTKEKKKQKDLQNDTDESISIQTYTRKPLMKIKSIIRHIYIYKLRL